MIIMPINSWSEFKSLVIVSKNLNYQYKEDNASYEIYASEDVFVWNVRLLKDGGSDVSDWESNYKANGNKPIKPVDVDGRVLTHSTARKRGLFTYFTSSGDGVADESVIGGNGTSLEYHHAVSGNSSEVMYIDFNTIANETYMNSGWMIWKDALNDKISLEIVPKLSTYTSGSNTNFNLYGGYLVIPAAGNGTISLTSIKLVEIPINEYGIRLGAGYWDATYNTSSKSFENLIANPYGTGRFNMFTVEISLDRFLNKINLLGSNMANFDAQDGSQLGHNMRLKVTFETAGNDHEWWFTGGFKQFRKKTI